MWNSGIRFLHRKLVFASALLTLILIILLIVVIRIEKTTLVKNNAHNYTTISTDNVKVFLNKVRLYLEDNQKISSKIKKDFKNTPDSDESGDIETKEFLESNSETFNEIADLLQETRQESEDQTIRFSKGNTWDIQVQSIKDWEPFYININYTESTEESQVRLTYLRNKLEEWDLFYLDFPDEQTQRLMLEDFKLPDAMYEDIIKAVDKFESNRIPIYNQPPKLLKLNDDDLNDLKSWQRFYTHMTQYQLYSPEDSVFKLVLSEMKTTPVKQAKRLKGGTQQKLLFILNNGLPVIFKPIRMPKAQEDLPDNLLWRQFEKHFSEIAMFHLDMVLGFHRVPPVVGRYFNVTRDIKELTDDKHMHFFRSPAGRHCFYGKCHYYCDTAGAVCGHPDIIEGSIMMFLPSYKLVQRKSWRSPWMRKYSHIVKQSVWEVDPNYCDDIKTIPPYNSGRRLLDMMDTAVFDFLAGNWDRHHYETFIQFGNFTSPILFDNGRGFGKSTHDKLTILAPVNQCCLFRYSTLKKLLAFYKGPKNLSDALRESLLADDTHPVLQEPHFVALDRRLQMVLRTVHKCISQNGYNQVVKDDGF